MRLTVKIALASAVAGGLAGVVVGAALTGGGTSTGPTQAAGAPAAPRVAGAAGGAAPTPEAIYRSDAPGVVVITSTQPEQVPGSLFAPPAKEQVSALGSGFVLDERGDVVTNDHVVQAGPGSVSASPAAPPIRPPSSAPTRPPTSPWCA